MNSGVEFAGDFFDGQMYHGILKYTNGLEYSGFFIDNKKHGHGKLIYANGMTFEGIYLSIYIYIFIYI
jgi:hypothetical protein